jgi:hypothetical protein
MSEVNRIAAPILPNLDEFYFNCEAVHVSTIVF